jgi:hypothetical protein
MNFIRHFILFLVVLASQPVFASGGELALVGLFFFGVIFLALPCAIILFVLIIISTILLIQHRFSPNRQLYGKVAEIISYILIPPFPIFVIWFLSVHATSTTEEKIIAGLITCTIATIFGGISVFLARKVKNLSPEELSD